MQSTVYARKIGNLNFVTRALVLIVWQRYVICVAPLQGASFSHVMLHDKNVYEFCELWYVGCIPAHACAQCIMHTNHKVLPTVHLVTVSSGEAGEPL